MAKKQKSKMDHVWAPWRMKYIQETSEKGCFFCKGVHQDDGKDNLIVKRGKFAFVMLNRYPYTSGHLMVVPYAHEASMEKLPLETKTEIMALITQAIQVLKTEYGAQGFNVGANLGSIAGAGVADHLHFHVVPRWDGDTNFMTSIGDARVLPENLSETHKRIKEHWPKETD